MLTQEKNNQLIVVTGDFSKSSAGKIATVALDKAAVGFFAEPIHTDAIARLDPNGDRLYVVNRRGQDNLTTFSLTGETLLKQFSLYTYSFLNKGLDDVNAQDIVPWNHTSALVSRWNSNMLIRINPETGEYLNPPYISYALQSDSDLTVDPAKMARVGERAWVQLQRLDRKNFWVPAPPSYIGVVDFEAGRSEKLITLKGTNPSSDFVFGGNGKVYVSCAGKFGVLDGGIEQLDIATAESDGIVVKESDLGGEIVDFAVAGSTAWAIAYNAKFDTRLLKLKLPEWKIEAQWLETDGKNPLQSLIHDAERNLIFVASRDVNQPSVIVFDAETGSEVTRYDVGLPPVQMVLAR